MKEKPTPDTVDLPSSITASFNKFITSKTSQDFESFLSDLRTCSALDSDQQSFIYGNITTILEATLPKTSIFPMTKNDEKLAESISYPIFGLFRTLYQYEEKCKKCIINLLSSVHSKLPNTGYLLLFFLKCHMKLQSLKNKNSKCLFKGNIYKMLCECIGENLETSLAKDLEQLEQESSQMFLWILPDVYREFKCMINNSEVLKTLVGCVDAKNVRDIIYSITQGKLTIFKKEGIIKCVRESLNYETFEQLCIWQLIQAHDVPIEYLQVKNNKLTQTVFVLIHFYF